MASVILSLYNGLTALLLNFKANFLGNSRETRSKRLVERGFAGDVAGIPKPLSTPLYALIIGISSYQHLPCLRGASADAQAVRNFLVDVIGVPIDQIVTLLDEEATRTAIIDALNAFVDNSQIQPGDAILFYFAGHGTRATVAEDPRSSAKVTAILSHDFNGENVHPIIEYTWDSIFSSFQRRKGDNSTVIFDCGYHGSLAGYSGTRGVTLDPDYVVPCSLPPDSVSDQPMSNTRGVNVVLAPTGSDAYVCLAACGHDEQAKEHANRGQFTVALLDMLARNDLNELTYTGLEDLLDAEGHDAHFEGSHLGRPIFNSKIETSKRSYRAELCNSAYTVHAGIIDDITVGAEFSLYPHVAAVGRLSPLGSAVARSVGPFQSQLKISTRPHALIPNHTFAAVLTNAGPIPLPGLYVTSNAALDVVRPALDTLTGAGDTTIHFTLVNNRSQAHLELSITSEEGETLLVVDIVDRLILSHGFTDFRKKISTKTEEVAHFLKTAAHFFHHLHSSVTNPVISSKIQIEFRELRGRSKKTLTAGDDLLRDGQLSLDVDRSKRVLHGIRLVNDSNRDLFLNAFYFDCSQLSIAHFYGMSRPTKSSSDAPLLARASLTLGYGPERASALAFFVPPGQAKDLGFFKVVFSTKPVDLVDVPCPSAFEPSAMGQPDMPRGRLQRHAAQHPPTLSDALGTVRIPIILRDVSPTI